MKRFLFIVNGTTAVDEMTTLGCHLETDMNYESFYFVTKPGLAERLQKNNISKDRIIVPSTFSSRLHRFFILKLLGELRFCYSLLKKWQIDGIGLYGDFNLSFCLSFIKASKQLNIKSFVLPVAIAEPNFIAYGRLKNGHDQQSLSTKFLKKILPNQVYNFNGQDILFYPPGKTVWLWLLGMLPPKPWFMGAGKTDCVMLQFKFQKQKLLSLNVEPEKLLVTGQLAFDSLFKSRQRKDIIKQEIFSAGELNPSRPTMVVALPQLAEHDVFSWENHWKIIDSLIEKLSGENLNVVLSLHPKMKFENYQKYVRPGQIWLSKAPLKEVLPVGDIFLAGFGSTIFWAVSLGIPSIFLSYLDLGYSFADVPGVYELHDQNDFSNAVNWAKQNKSKIIEADEIDGMTLKRMLSIIDNRLCEVAR